MADDNDVIPSLNRRSILQKAGASIIASPLIAATATASPDDKTYSNQGQINKGGFGSCGSRVLASSDKETLLRIPNVEIDDATVKKAVEAPRKYRLEEGQANTGVSNVEWKIPDYDDEFLVRINREEKVIKGALMPTEQLDALDTHNISAGADELQMTGSGTISTRSRFDYYVRDYKVWGERFGTCGGVTAKYHYGAGIAIYTGNSWSRITGAVLGDILCALTGTWWTKLISAFWGGAVCAAVGSEIYNFFGPSSAVKGTWGMWDTHRGWGNIEHLVRGRAKFWTTTHSNMTYTYSVPSAHIGQLLNKPGVIIA